MKYLYFDPICKQIDPVDLSKTSEASREVASDRHSLYNKMNRDLYDNLKEYKDCVTCRNVVYRSPIIRNWKESDAEPVIMLTFVCGANKGNLCDKVKRMISLTEEKELEEILDNVSEDELPTDWSKYKESSDW